MRDRYLFPGSRPERARAIVRTRRALRRMTTERLANGGRYATIAAQWKYWRTEDRLRALTMRA